MRTVLLILFLVVAPLGLVAYFIWRSRAVVPSSTSAVIPPLQAPTNAPAAAAAAQTAAASSAGYSSGSQQAASTAGGTLPRGTIVIDNSGGPSDPTAPAGGWSNGLAGAGAAAAGTLGKIPGVSTLAPAIGTVLGVIGDIGGAIFGNASAPDQTQVSLAWQAAHNAAAHGTTTVMPARPTGSSPISSASALAGA